MLDGKYGEGTVDTVRKMNYNKSADKKQYDQYKQVLGEEAEEHLKKSQASASYLGSLNTAVIRDEATVSDVLEEMYHARQDRTNAYGNLLTEDVYLKREIEAQKYMLSVVDKYKIPIEEVETTRKNL